MFGRVAAALDHAIHPLALQSIGSLKAAGNGVALVLAVLADLDRVPQLEAHAGRSVALAYLCFLQSAVLAECEVVFSLGAHAITAATAITNFFILFLRWLIGYVCPLSGSACSATLIAV